MSWVIAIASLCFTSYIAQAENTDTPNYCDPGLCNGQVHIGCKMQLDYAKSCTINADAIHFGDEEQEFILKTFNQMRNKVARGNFKGFNGAANMTKLVWDNELAYLAQLNVLQCELQRDPCRNTQRFKSVGQTVSYRGQREKFDGLDEMIRRHVSLWFNEERFATMEDIVKYKGADSKPLNNFAQIVYDRTQNVGCAALQQSKNGWFQTFMTCNFDEAPVMGKPIFRSSHKPAKKCISGRSQTFKFLCGESQNLNNQRQFQHIKQKDRNHAARQNVTSKTKMNQQNRFDFLKFRSDIEMQTRPADVEDTNKSKHNINKIVTEIELKSLETEIRQATFNRFIFKMLKAATAKNRRIMVITMNHQVDVNNEMSVPDIKINNPKLQSRTWPIKPHNIPRIG